VREDSEDSTLPTPPTLETSRHCSGMEMGTRRFTIEWRAI
jgi:hypothetical protein